MDQHPNPIFYDERGRRWPALLRLWAAIGLCISVLSLVFVLSVTFAPKHAPLLLRGEIPPPLFGKPELVESRDAARRRFALERRFERTRDALRRQMGLQNHPLPPARAHARDRKPLSVVAGFYVNWNAGSFPSLRRHADALTHLIPEWMHVGPDGSSFTTEESPRVIKFAASRNLPILPLLNNVANTEFQPERVHKLLNSPSAQARLIPAIVAWLEKNHFRGLNLDLESAPEADRGRMTAFVEKLADALHLKGLLMSQDIPVDDGAYDVGALGAANDFIVPMLYDEHDSSGEAGPLASQDWFETEADKIYALVPPEKVVLGIGSYGYDWQRGRAGAGGRDYEEAIIGARDNGGRITFDQSAYNPRYAYTDDQGNARDVWFLDAATAYNEIRSQRQNQPLGAALWVLGSEDPSLWSFFHRGRLGDQPGAAALRHIAFTQEVDFQGTGEIMDVDSTPTEGLRTVSTDADGYIRDEVYTRYPTPFSIRLYGRQKNSIALTFDDGPDPTWTPRILDILEKYHVPATFFLVGEQAQRNPAIVRREFADGHELGNHSFTHPDMSVVSRTRERLELDATQRVIEALTGHSTHLLRMPYTVDTTPDTAPEVHPLALARDLGYITCGANVDPNDWARPGVHAILWGGKNLKTVAPDVTSVDGIFPMLERARRPNADVACNIILLHDAGGDRSQTVAALPSIIEGLQKRGYMFTTVGGLLGKSRDAVMPAVSGRDAMLVGADRVWFNLLYGGASTLQWLFYLALFLGVARVLLTMGFALAEARRARTRTFDPSYRPSVSVIIAAYNEAEVIERTVANILASNYPDLEIIVVDDGSTDETYGVAWRAFARDPRASILRQPNGGKASALNEGLRHARGEIFIGLDADTLFAPNTISLLVRHFADPRVAAVAGNVKVGNRINLWTIWQSLEYITSQNFDRRAAAALNCITVVPGAVGAWRRAAVEKAGGYRADTLAEDTDVTLRVRRLGYRIEDEPAALAYTEAPDTLKTLARQRFRWAFGTLQCLWKHRDTLGRRQYGALGTVALPALWVFQMGFQVISPIVDIAILWAALTGNLPTVLAYAALFFLVDMAGAAVAVALDHEDGRLLPWMFLQRFAYRQLMYYVIFRSVMAAFRGRAVGWGKMERKGTVTVA